VRSKGYGPDRDPVGRYVGDDLLGRALRALLTPSERRLLNDYLHQAPPEQIARRHGLSKRQFDTLLGQLLGKIANSRYADELRSELNGFGPRHSPELWAGARHVPVHRCRYEGCDAPPFVQRSSGRPRLYCSSACRQADYRLRRSAPPGSPGEESNGSLGKEGTGLDGHYHHRSYQDPPPEFPAPVAPYRDYGREYFEAAGIPVLEVDFEILPSGRRPRPTLRRERARLSAAMRRLCAAKAPAGGQRADVSPTGGRPRTERPHHSRALAISLRYSRKTYKVVEALMALQPAATPFPLGIRADVEGTRRGTPPLSTTARGQTWSVRESRHVSTRGPRGAHGSGERR
jgi:DNA-binding CsgD family transcriptional regulator